MANARRRAQPKYDEFNRPTDPDAPEKFWMVARPHGRGAFRYETGAEAEHHAERFARQYEEPITVWQGVAVFEPMTEIPRPIRRVAIEPEPIVPTDWGQS